MFECDCCGKIFHDAPFILDNIEKMFCSGGCMKLEQGIVPEYTKAQREAINKKIDSKKLVPRRVPLSPVQFVIAPGATPGERDLLSMDMDTKARLRKMSKRFFRK